MLLPVLLALVALVFLGALRNDFLWDDHVLFVANPALRADPISWAMVSRPVLEGTVYLRPLVLLTWALEFRMWGVNAFAAHAVNLAFHLINVVLVFLLARRVIGPRIHGTEWRAGVAALLYGLHPSMTEVVCWVSGRFDLMVTTFMLCALLADARLVSRMWRAAVLSALFALALACKELALMLPPMLLAMRLLRRAVSSGERPAWGPTLRILWNDWPTVVGLGAVFVGWIVLRLDTLGVIIHDSRVAPALPPGTLLYTHVLLIFNTVWFYVTEILLPFGRVGPLHPLQFEVFKQPVGLMQALGGVATVAAVMVLVIKRPVQGLLLASAFLGLFPVLQIVPLSSAAMSIGSDRFLTLPLAFVAIAVATIPLPLTERVRPGAQALGAGLLGGGWLLLSIAVVTVTVPLWRSEWTLWSWAYQRHPESVFAQRAYVHEALRGGHYQLAGEVLEKLRARGPLQSFQQIQYGQYLARIGETNEAENYLKGGMLAYGIGLDGRPVPGQFEIFTASDRLIVGFGYRALAEIEQTRENFEKALEYLDQAIRYLPESPIYLVVKGNFLLATGRLDEADATYLEAFRLVAPQQRESVALIRDSFLNEWCQNHHHFPRPACGPHRDQSSHGSGL